MLELPPATRQANKAASWRAFGWIALVFGLIFFFLSVEGWRYRAGGIRTTGIVERMGISRGKGANYFVFYRFSTPDGQTVQGRSDVLPGTYRALEKGGPVAVEYLESSPGTNRVPDQRARPWIFALMAAACWTGGVTMLVKGRRRPTPA